MEISRELHTVVSGSFEFKPEIDLAHEEFKDYNVLVLAPDKGWLYIPTRTASSVASEIFRPLPNEYYMSIREIEDSFLQKLQISDFLYLMDLEGYIGCSTAYELGYALAKQKPIYAIEPLNYDRIKFDDLQIKVMIQEAIRVMPIKDVASHFREHFVVSGSPRIHTVET